MTSFGRSLQSAPEVVGINSKRFSSNGDYLFADMVFSLVLSSDSRIQPLVSRQWNPKNKRKFQIFQITFSSQGTLQIGSSY